MKDVGRGRTRTNAVCVSGRKQSKKGEQQIGADSSENAYLFRTMEMVTRKVKVRVDIGQEGVKEELGKRDARVFFFVCFVFLGDQSGLA